MGGWLSIPALRADVPAEPSTINRQLLARASMKTDLLRTIPESEWTMELVMIIARWGRCAGAKLSPLQYVPIRLQTPQVWLVAFSRNPETYGSIIPDNIKTYDFYLQAYDLDRKSISVIRSTEIRRWLMRTVISRNALSLLEVGLSTALLTEIYDSLQQYLFPVKACCEERRLSPAPLWKILAHVKHFAP